MLEDTDDEEAEVAEGEVPPGDHPSRSRCALYMSFTCAKPLCQVVPVFDCKATQLILSSFCLFVLHVSNTR